MADFTIKQGDTLPPIGATLKDAAGAALDLTGASVRFHMRPGGESAASVDQVCEIVDAAAGKVRYAWQVGDTDAPGSYVAEFEVTFSDGRVLTIPNTTNLKIKIVAQIA